MTEPYNLETILAEFDEEAEAWVLQDKTSGMYVTIPHPKYPGRNPIHFFMSESDAQDVLVEILDVNPKLKEKEIYPVKVKLIQTIKGVASGANKLGNADGFVVHSPNEVFEFINEKAI
jgi:hypothetical protein